MNSTTLTIVKLDPNGAIIWLEDGASYLVSENDHSIVHTWRVGDTVATKSVPYPPNGVALNLATKPSEIVSTIRVLG